MTTVAESVVYPGRLIRLWLLAIAAVAGCCQASCAAMPEKLPDTATNVVGLTVPDLKILQDQNHLYFVVPEGKPLPELIKLPRLANIVVSIRWISEEKATMQVKSEPTEWTIVLSQPPGNAERVIVAELDAPVQLFHEDMVARPDKVSGIILLPARLAVTRGKKLRFEPQPYKNTLGYWSDEHDTAEWSFQSSEAGIREIDILQGCGNGHGGSKVTVQVADQSLDFVVKETGHFQNFIWRNLGSVTLKKNDPEATYSLKLTPQSKPGGAVMDVRAVRLCPAGSPRTFAPELASPESLPIEIKR